MALDKHLRHQEKYEGACCLYTHMCVHVCMCAGAITWALLAHAFGFRRKAQRVSYLHLWLGSANLVSVHLLFLMFYASKLRLIYVNLKILYKDAHKIQLICLHYLKFSSKIFMALQPRSTRHYLIAKSLCYLCLQTKGEHSNNEKKR